MRGLFVAIAAVVCLKNVGTVAAKAVNAFVLEKGKPRVTPVQ
jgi:hypothetical protein